jgi:diguanylate cyclase (GGDEF)-like protein
MDSPTAPPTLASLPSAFAAACRQATSDSELFERCREALVRQFHSDRIWFSVTSPGATIPLLPPPEWLSEAIEVIRLTSGKTELAVLADPAVAAVVRPQATAIALGLSVMLELHGVLRERQGQLDDSVFQLRALRQVARLLSSVHSAEETEHLVLDFVAEVFFCWWACLYRPLGEVYVPKVVRSLKGSMSLSPIERTQFERSMPSDSPVGTTEDPALAKLFPPSAKVIVALDAGAERLAVLALGPRLHDMVFGQSEYDLAGSLAFAAAIALKNAQLVEQLQSAATTDPLTTLLNRRAMEERLETELARTLRHQIRTSIVMLDVDLFKAVNDTLGHAAGDRLLVELSRVLRHQCRSLDSVGRVGGDEFLIILPMTTAEETLAFVSRLRRAVALLEKTHPEFGRTSLSMGIAESPRHGATADAILGAADAALYRAKRGGRDAVETAEDP